MTQYETIFKRRQVRQYSQSPLEPSLLHSILDCAVSASQLAGQKAVVKLASADEVDGGQAPHYLLSYCDASAEAYANVGYVLQAADLYIQSLGLGSGWFMSAKPKTDKERFCIALAFGGTDVPMRQSETEFKRVPAKEIPSADNAVVRAVRLAPSSLNSQPWKLEFETGKVIVCDAGRGMKRIILKNKLNKIDVGIAARHAALALEQEGKKLTAVTPATDGKNFRIEITYV